MTKNWENGTELFCPCLLYWKNVDSVLISVPVRQLSENIIKSDNLLYWMNQCRHRDYSVIQKVDSLTSTE